MLPEVFRDPPYTFEFCCTFCRSPPRRRSSWNRPAFFFFIFGESADESFVFGGRGVSLRPGEAVRAGYGDGGRCGFREVVCGRRGDAEQRAGSGDRACGDRGEYDVVCGQLSADVDSGGRPDESGRRYGFHLGSLRGTYEGSGRERGRHQRAIHDSLEEAGRRFLEGRTGRQQRGAAPQGRLLQAAVGGQGRVRREVPPGYSRQQIFVTIAYLFNHLVPQTGQCQWVFALKQFSVGGALQL